MSSVKSIIEKIKALEAERKNLLLEIEELKRMADAKVMNLENEIRTLMEEMKSLRMLLEAEETKSELEEEKKK